MPADLKLHLLDAVLCALVLHVELGAGRNPQRLARDLYGEWALPLNGVSQPPKLGGELTRRVYALEISGTFACGHETIN